MKKLTVLLIVMAFCLTGCSLKDIIGAKQQSNVAVKPVMDEVSDESGDYGFSADGSSMSNDDYGAVAQISPPNEEYDGVVVEESSDDYVDSSETNQSGLTEDVLDALIQENVYVLYNIFGLGNLQYDYDAWVDGEYIYQVTDPNFPDYASLENYLLSVYTAEYVDVLLNQTPMAGDTLYINRDGALYINTMYVTGSGYYTDWSNCTYEITYISDTECSFVAHATDEYPGEGPTEYVVESTAVYENGRWVLTEKIE